MNASIGFSELLKLEVNGKLNAKQKHYIDIVIKSNHFLLTLINDILDLCMVEAKKLDLNFEEISIPQAIENALLDIKDKAEQQKVQFKVELDPQIEFIDADKQRFKQILLNLLGNAAKFSKKNGGLVTVRSTKEGEMVKISISDTGIGIKKEDIGRLFNNFEQLESGSTRKYSGAGLGLSISKKLVEIHSGRIWIESTFGKGTTLNFTLPIHQKSGDKTQFKGVFK